MALPVFEVELTKEGKVFDGREVEAAIAALSGPAAGVTDLVVFAHGWNNDKADARALREKVFGAVEGVLEGRHGAALAGRKLAVLALLWPSKRFTEEELIPDGAAGLGGGGEEMRVLQRLEALRTEPVRLGVEAEIDHHRQANLDLAKGLVPRLAADPDAQKRFVELVLGLLSPGNPAPEDAADSLFGSDPVELLRRLGEPVPPPPLPAGEGGAALAGGAAGLGDFARGALAGARRLLNFTTYYEMKERAGIAGKRGAAEVVLRLRAAFPDLRFHLVGHSFGGRLVTALADALPAAARPSSLTLLQAAFSHNGFAVKFDGRNDGFFRRVVSGGKVRGPIVVSHTRNDRAVGVAYPLASRIARQNAAALGDAGDPYGGMGRNGARHTPEALDLTLGEVGADYPFAAGKVFNLQSDRFIAGHGEIGVPQVAWALVAACSVP